MRTDRLRKTFRASALGATACVLAATAITVLAPAASAFEQDRLVLEPDGAIEVSYSPIPASNPTGEAAEPDTCPTSAYCDLIPLTVIEDPTVTEEDEYFISVTLSWESQEAEDPVVTGEPIAANDMDLYGFVDPVDDTSRHEVTEDNGEVGCGCGLSQPETFFLFKPVGDYNLVINNYLGANTGYTISIVWVSEAFPTPFESLAPGFTPPTTVPPSTTTTTTTTTPPPSTAPTTTVAPPPTLAPAEIDLDADDGFAQFDDGSEFEDQLAAPAPVDLQPVSRTKPAPPSTVALLFWFLAVPLAATAAVSGVLLRRRTTLV